MSDLITRLLLRSEQFDSGFKKSRQQVLLFDKNIQQAGASVKSFIGGFAGMAGISMGLMDIVQTSTQFDKAMSSLRSLTGVGVEELNYFKREAIKLGGTSTQTAKQVVDAFKLIGSQKPELLKSKEGLVDVTKQAIILAEAAEIEVPEAAKALTGALNQMGESTEQAATYINILAAASQKGSAAIPYLNKAVEKAGGTASSVGIKFNELIASIEAIAPKISEASEAGTYLRNIFLALESSSDEKLRPSVVGLSEALKNLSEKQLSVVELTKMFGKENVTAALALVNAKDDYLRYSKAITGTNTAIEQQRINNENLAGSLKSVSSAWEKLVLTLDKSQGSLMQAANFVAAILHRITEATKSESQKQEEAINNAITEQKQGLDRMIKSYEDFYSRAQAIKLTMQDVEKTYGDGTGLTSELKNAENRLMQLETQLNSFLPKTGFDKSLHTVVPYSHLSLNDVSAKNKIEEEIEAQKELINTLKIKNEKYRTSIEYLKKELEETNNVKDAGTTKGQEQTIDKKKFKQLKEIDDVAFKAKNEIEKEFARVVELWGQKDVELFKKNPYSSILSLEMPEEEQDITGSVKDIEEQIQTVTLAYNEATTNALRALYADRKTELEKHLAEITDINQGMIDITDEMNSMIQSGVVNAFSSIGDAIGSSNSGEAMKRMLLGMMDLLQQFGAALVAAGMAKIAFDKLLFNPYAAIAAGGALIIAVSIAKSAINSVHDFADGAVVYGETFARVGEYAGASTNPEVIAPLNKLRDILKGDDENNTQGSYDVSFRVKGEDLVAVLNKYNRRIRRTE